MEVEHEVAVGFILDADEADLELLVSELDAALRGVIGVREDTVVISVKSPDPEQGEDGA